LNAAVLLALFALRFGPQETSSLRKIWWGIVGGSASLLVLLSFRRSFWAELAIGALILAALRRKRRLVAFGLIVVVAALVAGLGGDRVYQRVKSMNPFVPGQAEYTSDNEDHVNEVLDAIDQVQQTPILGIGLGKMFRTPRTSDWKAESWGVHNGLLHAWLLYGLLGLVAYLWFHVSLFRWLHRLQQLNVEPRVRSLAQVALAYLIGPFLVSFGFSPWLYGALNNDTLVAFILGSLLVSHSWSLRGETRLTRLARQPRYSFRMAHQAMKG
jgi:O-antigen ligase